jgi:hypothetical protein
MAIPTGDWGGSIAEGMRVGMGLASMRRQQEHDAWERMMGEENLGLRRAALDRMRIQEEHQTREDQRRGIRENFNELNQPAAPWRQLGTQYPEANAAPAIGAFENANMALARDPSAVLRRGSQPNFIGQTPTTQEPMGPFPADASMPAQTVRGVASQEVESAFGKAKLAQEERRKKTALEIAASKRHPTDKPVRYPHLEQEGRAIDAMERQLQNEENAARAGFNLQGTVLAPEQRPATLKAIGGRRADLEQRREAHLRNLDELGIPHGSGIGQAALTKVLLDDGYTADELAQTLKGIYGE